jgi:hypothetical protein
MRVLDGSFLRGSPNGACRISPIPTQAAIAELFDGDGGQNLAPALGVEFVLIDHARRDQVQNHVQQPGFELSIVIGVEILGNLIQKGEGDLIDNLLLGDVF